nr:cytochrome d ubiquinol oxidase subunit II [Candidatus Frankia alpina]
MLWRHRFAAARIAAGLAVAGVLWGWVAARYPDLVVGHATVASAAAPEANLIAMIIVTGLGMAVIVASMFVLFRLFFRPDTSDAHHN